MPSTTTATTVEKCTNCDAVIEGTQYKLYNGRYKVCLDCVDNDYFICEECGKLEHNDEACENDDGESLCRRCFENNYFYCEHCGDSFNRNEEMRGCDDNSYCNDCYCERFDDCSECGETHWRDDLYYDENDDCYVCSECRNASPKVIHQYSYKPEPIFYKLPHETELYMGFELEVETANADKTAFDLLEFMKEKKIDKHYYFKYDGSVEGFEIVTHPFTIGYFHKNMKLKEILKWLQQKGCKSYRSGRCGFHVHVSSNFFEDSELAKVRSLFVQWFPELMSFSRRKDRTDFCKFETSINKSWFTETVHVNTERYRAVNLTNSSTVEFRLFRGTLGHIRLIASLQFCDAISNYVKHIGIAHCLKKQDYKGFVEWCKREGKYSHFVKYCVEKNIGKLDSTEI